MARGDKHGVAHDPAHADGPPRVVLVPPPARALHVARGGEHARHDDDAEGELALEALQAAEGPPGAVAHRVQPLRRLDGLGDALRVVGLRVLGRVVYYRVVFPGFYLVDQLGDARKGLAVRAYKT